MDRIAKGPEMTEKMTEKMTGGCHCGAVRYELDACEGQITHCFCTDCQKLTGTQMSSNFLVPSDQFRVTKGVAKSYANPGESGEDVVRYFCGTCGTPLWGEPKAMPGLTVIKVGSLDDAAKLNAGASIYVASAPGWAEVPSNTRHFEAMPPM